MLTPHWIRRVKSPSRSKRCRSHARRLAQAHGAIRWHVEYLEERTLLAVIVSGVPDWIPAGPYQTTNGQIENIPGLNGVNPVIGAIQTVAAHPSNPNILYVGSVNGGIWKTENATDAVPLWEPLTDQYPSLSIAAIEFDPTDSFGNTLVAAIGQTSSLGRSGGALKGLLKTTNGGRTWQQLGQTALSNVNLGAVVPQGSTIIVGANAYSGNAASAGVWRSTDGGQNWTRVSNIDSDGDLIPDTMTGAITDLVADPGKLNRIYAAELPTISPAPPAGAPALVRNGGIWRSDDAGATWVNVTRPGLSAVINQAPINLGTATNPNWAGTNNIEIAVHSSSQNAVYAAVMFVGSMGAGNINLNGTTILNPNPGGGFFRSGNAGGTWVQMDTPQTNEGGTAIGLQPRSKPGGQGATHFSIIADPNDPWVAYVGGDRQPGPLPNSLGAQDSTGRLFRGDFTLAAGAQWTSLTHNGTASNSAPHADSRDMVFDLNGDLIEADDGGIYRRTSAGDSAGDWISLIGYQLQVTEFHNIAFDNNSLTFIGGAQDTGVHDQGFPGQLIWNDVTTADGGDVAVDNQSRAGRNESVRFHSNQNLGTFTWRVYDQSGNFVGLPVETVFSTAGGPVWVRSPEHGLRNGDQVVIYDNLWLDANFPQPPAPAPPITYTVAGATADAFQLQELNGFPGRTSGPGGSIEVRPQLNLAGFGTPILNFAPFITTVEVNPIDGRRLVFGAATDFNADGTADASAIYESFNRGSTVIQLTNFDFDGDGAADFNAVGPGNLNALAYGGWMDGAANPDVIYAAVGTQVFVRASTTTQLWKQTAPLPAPLLGANFVMDVVTDPTDWGTVYAITSNQNRVFQGTNVDLLFNNNDDNGNGIIDDANEMTWTNITGRDLDGDGFLDVRLADPNLRTIQVLKGAVTDAILVGGDTGVSRMLLNNPGVWSEFGAGLPNAPVWDIDYDATADVLAVGTLGRGAWGIPDLSDTVFTRSVLEINGTAGIDLITLSADEDNPLLFHVGLLGGTQERHTFQQSVFEEVRINGLGSTDLIGVNLSNGKPYSGFLNIDAGSGDGDFLVLSGSITRDVVRLLGESVSFDFNAPDLTYEGVENLQIFAEAGNDQIFLNAVLSGTTVTVSGQDDDDFVSVGGGDYFDNIKGAVTIEGNAGLNALSINDRFDTSGNRGSGRAGSVNYDTYTLKAGSFDKSERTMSFFGEITEHAQTLTFISMSSVTLLASDVTPDGDRPEGTTAIDVESVTSGTTLTVNTNDGNDTINYNVSPIAIGLSVTFNGGPGNNVINVNQTGVAASVTINAREGNDVINVDQTGDGSTVIVNGGLDDDTFHIGNGNFAGNILGTVTLDGSSDHDQLVIHDTFNAFGAGVLNDHLFDTSPDDPELGRFVKFINAKPFPVSETLSFRLIESVEVLANAFNNEIHVDATIVGATYTLRGGSGRDEFFIKAAGLSSTVEIHGGPPDDPPGDSLLVTGVMTVDGLPSSTGEYRNEGIDSGEVDIDGQTVEFHELEPVTIVNFQSFTFVSEGSRDDIVVDSPEAERSRVSGITDGVSFENLTFFDVPEIVLDLARNDGADPDDSVLIQPGALQARGLQKMTIRVGAGEAGITILDTSVPVTIVNDEGTTHNVFVTHTRDSGSGSLRAAIEAVNRLTEEGQALITFAILATDPGFMDIDGDADPDVFVISPVTALPALTRGNVVIKGQSQHALTGDTNPFGPEIVLTGHLAGAGVNGLQLASSGNFVHGLNIQGFSGNGVLITGNVNTLTGNYIGTSATGDEGMNSGGVTLFAEGFEGDLSTWVGKNGGPHNGLIVADPLRPGNHVLTFSALNVLGDVFGPELTVTPGQTYQLTFEYLGRPGLGGMEEDLGGVIGFTDGLPGTQRWLAGTVDYPASAIEDDPLVDDGQWHTYTIAFDPYGPGPYYPGIIGDTLRIMLEDWDGSLGVPGDALFDNIRVSVGSVPTSAANGGHGVHIVDSSGNQIGGTAVGAANLISGNAGFGLHIYASSGNLVQGNTFGLSAAGDPLGNNQEVIVDGGADNTIGGGAVGAGNVIAGGNEIGVVIHAATGTRLQGNWIGTDRSLSAGKGNGSYGVAVYGAATGNYIGTDGDGVDDASEGNVIVENGSYQVIIHNPGTDNNVVAGNAIGTDPLGTRDLGSSIGVYLFNGAKGNRIGTNADGISDEAERNLISGNASGGVVIQSDDNIVAGNYIGTDATGNTARPNGGGIGIQNAANNIIGGTAPAARNVISGNGAGVAISGSLATGNHVAGNYIGVGADGITHVPNFDGIVIQGDYGAGLGAQGNIIGGDDALERNVISFNVQNNVHLNRTLGTIVQGNYIGTDSTGTQAGDPATTHVGIRVSNDQNSQIGGIDAGNVIAGAYYGIYLIGQFVPGGTQGTRIEGNLLGTTADGQQALWNQWGIYVDGLQIDWFNSEVQNVRIGGTAEGAGNVISADGQRVDQGIVVRGSGARGIAIQGNKIGTDIDGIDALPNVTGVLLENTTGVLVGGTDEGAGNLISGNTSHGIWIVGGSGHMVQGNYIGATADGLARLGNGLAGISVLDSSDNLIGGDATASGLIGMLGNHVVTLDHVSGDAAEVGTTPALAHVQGLSWHTGLGALFGIADAYLGTDPKLMRVDPATGVAAAIGSIDIVGPFTEDIKLAEAMAYNPTDGLLYAAVGTTSPFSNRLVTIDPATGQATFVANITGTASNDGDAFAFVNGVLYAVDVAGSPSYLYTIDLQTGQATLVGEIGHNNVGDLAYDPDTQTLYGMDPGARLLITIDLATGGGTPVGSTHTSAEFDGSLLYAMEWMPGTVSNVISGNTTGVSISGPLASGNHVAGNYIGVGADGHTVLGNWHGVTLVGTASGNLIGGTSDAERNVISANLLNNVLLGGTMGTTVQGNYIGTDATGQHVTAYAQVGIRFYDDHDSLIGGTANGAGNVVSGNFYGIYVTGGLATGGTQRLRIEGNLVGTTADGQNSIPNFQGIYLDGFDSPDQKLAAHEITIGGVEPRAGNVVSANHAGITVRGPNLTGIKIQGNKIGTDIDGIDALPNGNVGNDSGVLLETVSGVLVGGTEDGAGNLISGNTRAGISIVGGSDHTILGNLIGLAVDGTALGNTAGVHIHNSTDNQVGDGTPEGRNIISASTVGYGVAIQGSAATRNVVDGNYIGTDSTGTQARGNFSGGVGIIDTAGNTLRGNLISGNPQNGVFVYGSTPATDMTNFIEANYIGTDATGMRDLGNALMGIRVFQGVGAELRGNVVSGNDNTNIHLDPTASGVLIEGNLIGTDATGNQRLVELQPVLAVGVGLSGHHNTVRGNVISGNPIDGVHIDGGDVLDGRASGNILESNLIGVGADGVTPLGNGRIGVHIRRGASNNRIGTAGFDPNVDTQGNVIAYNAEQGVAVVDGTSLGNTIRGNSIRSNGNIGIDLAVAGEGVSFNDYDIDGPPIEHDKDLGPNLLQNYPDLTSARVANDYSVTGTLKTVANTTLRIDFYASPAADPAGFRQGARWIGSKLVTTNGDGETNINATVIAIAVDELVTATATDSSGNTSEFSEAIVVRGAGGPPGGGGGGKPLIAASMPATSSRESITSDQLGPIVDEALARWRLAGRLHGSGGRIDVGIKDLPDNLLGMADGRTIWLDVNAAGWGWFIDPTPDEDSEFSMSGDQGELDRMDLLSALMHEIGHLLGWEHHDDERDVMYESLSAGQRAMLNDHELGQLSGWPTWIPPRASQSAGSPSLMTYDRDKTKINISKRNHVLPAIGIRH